MPSGIGALIALEAAVELEAFSGEVLARVPALLTLLVTLANVARGIVDFLLLRLFVLFDLPSLRFVFFFFRLEITSLSLLLLLLLSSLAGFFAKLTALLRFLRRLWSPSRTRDNDALPLFGLVEIHPSFSMLLSSLSLLP